MIDHPAFSEDGIVQLVLSMYHYSRIKRLRIGCLLWIHIFIRENTKLSKDRSFKSVSISNLTFLRGGSFIVISTHT